MGGGGHCPDPPNNSTIQVVPRYNIISGTCEKICYSETYVIPVSDIYDYRNFFAKISPCNGCVGVNSLGITFLCYKQFNEHYHLNSQLTTLPWAVKSCVQCVDGHVYCPFTCMCELAHTCTWLSTPCTRHDM